jgi:cobalamin biosynthesis Mg chelatase CobN
MQSMIREFRKQKESEKWHYSEKCRKWPLEDYDIWYGDIPPNCRELCNECYMKETEKRKRSEK